MNGKEPAVINSQMGKEMSQTPIAGEVSITLEPARILPPAPPGTYLGVAENMLKGAELLAAEVSPPALPLAMLAAHTLECVLKAYLSRDGNDDRLKKPPLRHNLASLWALASDEGLRVPNSIPDWVITLSKLHDNPYYLRYSSGVHAVVTPPPNPMIRDLAQLLRLVVSQL